MAKLGEGDARWIVQEREDGTNVHGWHWSEKDILKWSQTRLGELLGNRTLLEGEGQTYLSTGSIESVTGEALINNRKKKLIPSYELAVKGQWQGHIVDGNGNKATTAKGTFQLPYISDENADEDPELTVALTEEGSGQQRLKQAFIAKGKQAIFEAVAQFVKEIKAGGPARKGASQQEAQTDSQAAQPSASKSSMQGAASQTQTNDTAQASQPKAKPAPKQDSGTHTIDIEETFYARAQDIFECFTQQGKIQAFTQSPAQAQPNAGGTFSMFGGSVQGTYRELQPFSKLTLDWRFGNWPDDCTSKVSIQLEEPEAGTVILSLHHTGIPHEDKFGNSDVEGTTRHGWQNLILHRIKAVFGYGL